MKLSQYLRAECVTSKIALRDKDDALRTAARLAGKCPVMSHIGEEVLFRALQERESIGSTGFGDGIAVPHCRLAQVREFVVGLMTVPDGVEFDSIDGQKAKLIVFVFGPEHETTEHIRLLSAISQVLRIEGAVEKLLAQESPQSLLATFLDYAAELAPREPNGERNLFHIFVRDEQAFKQTLEVFADIASASVAILDSESVESHLSGALVSLDFFGGSSSFMKVIVAVVDKPLTNEIIRRLESVVGPIGHRTDMLVTVQNVFFAVGALSR